MEATSPILSAHAVEADIALRIDEGVTSEAVRVLVERAACGDPERAASPSGIVQASAHVQHG